MQYFIILYEIVLTICYLNVICSVDGYSIIFGKEAIFGRYLITVLVLWYLKVVFRLTDCIKLGFPSQVS